MNSCFKCVNSIQSNSLGFQARWNQFEIYNFKSCIPSISIHNSQQQHFSFPRAQEIHEVTEGAKGTWIDWHHERTHVVVRISSLQTKLGNPLSFVFTWTKILLIFLCAHFIKSIFREGRKKSRKIERWFECASEWKIYFSSTPHPLHHQRRKRDKKIQLTWSRFSFRLCSWVAGWMMQKISCRENRITFTFLHIFWCGCWENSTKSSSEWAKAAEIRLVRNVTLDLQWGGRRNARKNFIYSGWSGEWKCNIRCSTRYDSGKNNAQ